MEEEGRCGGEEVCREEECKVEGGGEEVCMMVIAVLLT